tara:strand:+ start:59 stop:1549 length:1491 start_codon:yes stop_codon:yes gene_type:complete
MNFSNKTLFRIFIVVFFVNTFLVKAQSKKQPNIVLVLLDDVSPEQFSCYGVQGWGKTPNIDKLATDGVMFKTSYASAMCAPSRVEIMTGAYGNTTGVLQNGMWLGDSRENVYSKHQAFGKLLKDAGYATAIAGKWHAGMQMPYEKAIGFDEYCLWEGLKEIKKLPGSPKFTGQLEDVKTTSRYWHPGIIKNHKLLDTKPSDYGPDIFSDFIMDFMERKSKEGKPFLAYWPSVAPHGTRTGSPSTPHRGKVGDLGSKEIKAEEDRLRFIALNEYIDYLMGKIMKKIDDLGIAENTIVILTSDNGTAVTAKTRGVERGTHVVNIISGAGVKKRGATDELTDLTDIAPTLVELAGAKLPKGKKFDGKSLVPFLKGDTDSHRDWIYGYISTSQLVRTKDYMLEAVNPLLGIPEGRFYYTGKNRNQRGYEFVNGNPIHSEKRKDFTKILEAFPPITKDHKYWKTKKGKKFLKQYTNPKSIEKHLFNHKDYNFYDQGEQIIQ